MSQIVKKLKKYEKLFNCKNLKNVSFTICDYNNYIRKINNKYLFLFKFKYVLIDAAFLIIKQNNFEEKNYEIYNCKH